MTETSIARDPDARRIGVSAGLGRLRLVALGAVILAGIGLALVLVLPGAPTARGVVVALDQASIVEVRAFTLRTTDGQLLTFEIGTLDTTPPAFRAEHLREHLATALPIVVAYRADGGRRVAVRLVDAPP